METIGLEMLDALALVLVTTGAATAVGLATPGTRRAQLPGTVLTVLAALVLATTEDLLFAVIACAGLRAGLVAHRLAGESGTERPGPAIFEGLAMTAMAVLGLGFALAASGGTGIEDLGAAFGDPNPRSARFAGLALALTIASVSVEALIAPFHGITSTRSRASSPPERALHLGVARGAALIFIAKLLLLGLGPSRELWRPALWALAVLSLGLGEMGALRARNRDRLLWHLSVARSGGVLAAVLCVSHAGASAAVLAIAVDALALLVVIAVFSREGAPERVDSRIRIAGLVALASLAGLPGTVGALPRLMTIHAALQEQLVLLAFAVAISGALAIATWIRLCREYSSPSKPSDSGPEGLVTRAPALHRGLVTVVALLLLAAGLIPGGIVELAQIIATPLP